MSPMAKEDIIAHIRDKISNCRATKAMMHAAGQAQMVSYGEGAVDALESLLHELEERDWYEGA